MANWRLIITIAGLVLLAGLGFLAMQPERATISSTSAPAAPTAVTPRAEAPSSQGQSAIAASTVGSAARPGFTPTQATPAPTDCGNPPTQPPAATAGVPPPAVPLSEVLCLVAAAPQITTVPSDLLPPLAEAEPDFSIRTPAALQCFADTAVSEVPDCEFGDTSGSQTIVLHGDSFAFQWLPAFDAIGKRMHWKIVVLTKSACPTVALSFYSEQKKAPFVECDKWHDSVVPRINRLAPDLVVIATSSGGKDSTGKEIEFSEWTAAMARYLNSLTVNRKMVLMAPPQPRAGNQFVGPNCLAAHLNDAQFCSASKASTVPPLARHPQLVAAGRVGVPTVDISPWFCSDQCTGVIGKMNVYVRNGHVSGTYATYLSGALEGELRRLLGS